MDSAFPRGKIHSVDKPPHPGADDSCYISNNRLFIFMIYLLIAFGGAIGSVSRFWLSGLIGSRIGETFPWGTLWVNVTGCIVIGFIATLTGPEGRIFASSDSRQFLMTGICGGYTTFSSFGLQTMNLVRDGDWLPAAGNILASVILCLVGVWLGHIGATYLNQSPGG